MQVIPSISPVALRPHLLAGLTKHLDEGHFQNDLARRVAFRTESDSGANTESLQRYLDEEIAPTLQKLGFETHILPNPDSRGAPFLVARRIENAALPTLLSYAHGDVVSGQEGRWQAGLQPWQLTAQEGRFYGRGTADNKGQHSINLAALAHTLQARQGRLGYNITLLVEMGEEAGSPGLAAFCEQHRDLLSADLFLASDGPRVRAKRPTLFLGSRGCVNFSLRLNARERAYHSGNWGGVLVNPAVRLTHALASMVDAQGRILVTALRPSHIPEPVRECLQGLPIGGSAQDPLMDAQWGEPGLSPVERLVAWNSLEVLAMEAGSPQRPVNAIPPQAVAYCQLRFVVGTPWQDLASIVRQHLDAHGFTDIDIEITASCGATRLDVNNPWVSWAADSLRKTTECVPAVLPNLAGSLPNDVFADLLGLPTLWVPHSYPACAQHAPDEHLLVDVVRQGLQIMGGLFWDLGESTAPWH